MIEREASGTTARGRYLPERSRRHHGGPVRDAVPGRYWKQPNPGGAPSGIITTIAGTGGPAAGQWNAGNGFASKTALTEIRPSGAVRVIRQS
jgi:hypothetical protein